MSNNLTFVLFTACLFVVVFITRVLPFVFSRVLKNSVFLNSVAKYLPPYIMLLLVIFEIQIPKFFDKPFNVPALIALLVVAVVQWRWQKLLITLCASMVVYALVAWWLA